MLKSATIVVSAEMNIVTWPGQTEEDIKNEIKFYVAKAAPLMGHARMKIRGVKYTTGDGEWHIIRR